MASNKKPAIRSPFSGNNKKSAAASPKSTLRLPGNKGQNPRVASLSQLMDIAASVRPWKQPQHETIIAFTYQSPFLMYPHFFDNFKAVSTPSAPVFIGSAMSYPNMLVRRSANTGNLSL
nr:Uncharacterised protein [Ipomoea batatas]